jgi:transcription termination/antitermination protein NusG
VTWDVNIPQGDLYWYAVLCRSRHEKVIATSLATSGIANFLPMVSEVHYWSDRHKLVEAPLFPGYVFVQIPNSITAQLCVLKTRGVVRFVGNGQGPLAIPEEEISDVQTVLTQKVSCSPYPFLKLGQRVRICGGALDGIEGLLVGRDSDSKLVISVEIIQRALAISVYNLDIQPVESHATSSNQCHRDLNAKDSRTLML